MTQAIMNIVLSAGGVSIQGVISRDAEGNVGQEVSLPAADSGTLSTRTSDTAGTLTLGASHAIETGDTIDIFWTDANGNTKCAYGATVGTVSGTSVPFTGASGDVLPAQDTAITADEQVEISDPKFDGDNAVLIAWMSTLKGHVGFFDVTPASIKQATLKPNEPGFYASDVGMSNPLTGNPVDTICVTNGDSSAAATFKLAGKIDSVT